MFTLLQQGMSSLLAFEEISSRGMPASYSYFNSLYDEFTDEMVTLTDDLRDNYFDGRPINPNGNDALDFITHVRKVTSNPQIKCTKLTKKGAPSTAKDSIEHLRYLDGYAGEAFSRFFNWREIQHRRDGFCAPILDSMNVSNLHPGSTDIHNLMGELKITRTTSRRPSMGAEKDKGINLLNLPSRQGMGMVDGLNKRIRNGFIAPANTLLLANDLSQIELRCLAHESQDKLLLDIYRNDGDIHATTSEALFGVSPSLQDDSKHRKPAKTVNFLWSYGGGAHKLWTEYRKMNITQFTEEDCQRFIDARDNKYSGVTAWKEKVLWEARQVGYVSTHSGMRRYLPNLWSTNKCLRAKAEREAISHIIQGMAQDIIQYAMAWVYKEILALRDAGVDVWLALQLYDELIHRCDEDYVELVDEIVIEGLTCHHGRPDFRVPILADTSVGKCWGEL